MNVSYPIVQQGQQVRTIQAFPQQVQQVPVLYSSSRVEVRDDVQLIHQDPHSPSSFLQWILKILPLIFFILALIVSIILLAIYVTPNDEDGRAANSAINYLNLIKKSKQWKNIATLEYNSNYQVDDCPENYERITLSYWPGINEGCLCEDTTNAGTYNVFSLDHCKTQSSCKKVTPSFNPIELSSINKYEICVQFANPKDVEYKGSKDCKRDWKKCGSYCYNTKSEKCDLITGLTIKDTPCDGRTSFQISDTKCIQPNRFRDDPIVNLTVALTKDDDSTFEYPCLQKEYLPEKDLQPAYPLLKIKEKGCGKYKSIQSKTDPEFATQVFKMGNWKTYFSNYQVNRFYDKFFSTNYEESPAFYYKHYNDYDTARLIQVRRMVLTNEDNAEFCFDSTDFDIETIINSSKTLRSTYRVINALAIVLAVLGLIALIGYIILWRTRQHGHKKIDKIMPIIYILAYCLVIVYIVQASIHWYNVDAKGIRDAYNKAKKFADLKCYVEEKFNTPYEDLAKYIASTYKPYEPYVIFLFILAMVFLVVTIIIIIAKYAAKEEDE